MNIGTRSVLFGYHQFLLHPLFVALAWYRLHGFRAVKIGVHVRVTNAERDEWLREDVRTSLFDPRLWLAFFLHDLGYWGKPNMDGVEGEQHPFFAYRVMDRIFGAPWGTFCLYHSRFLARKEGESPSLLCAPDKLAIALYPLWLIVLLTSLTGEIREYMKHAKVNTTRWEWARDVQRFGREYAEKMKDGGADNITGTAGDSNTTARLHRATGVYT